MRFNFFTTSLVVALPLILVVSLITFNDWSVRPPQETSTELASRTDDSRKAPQATHSPKTDYNAPLSDAEKHDISYIINTLATKSDFSLMFEKSNLEKAGSRISNVNSLQMLTYIFSDPQLKTSVKKISGIPWKRFSKETAESLEKESHVGNITEANLQDYYTKIGVSSDLLDPLAKDEKWEKFINSSRDHISKN